MTSGYNTSPAVETDCTCPRCGNTSCLQGLAYYDAKRARVVGGGSQSTASISGIVLVALVLVGNVLIPRLILPKVFGIYDWHPGWLVYVPLVVAVALFICLEFRRTLQSVTMPQVEALRCRKCNYRWRPGEALASGADVRL